MTRRDDLVRLVAERRDNAHKVGREGAGLHRNAGDAGRVAALYAEAKRELDALIAQEDAASTTDPEATS